jgi:hypothetical protein
MPISIRYGFAFSLILAVRKLEPIIGTRGLHKSELLCYDVLGTIAKNRFMRIIEEK